MLFNLDFEALEGLIIFILALSAAQWLPISKSYHPSTLLSLIFERIQARVYPKGQASKYYIKLSALLAFILPITVILTLLIAFIFLAHYPNWIIGLMFYLCLDTQHERKVSRISTLLLQKQKVTARAVLQTLVRRDTNNLSVAGISKATIDTMVLRGVRQHFMIVSLFILHPYLCFFYKLLFICHQSWRGPLLPNDEFLKPIRTWLNIIEWLPIRGYVVLSAIICGASKTFHYIKHYATYCHDKNSGWILSLYAAIANRQLGGPSFYQDERFAKMRFGSGEMPDAKTVSFTLAKYQQIKLLYCGVIIMIWLLWGMVGAS